MYNWRRLYISVIVVTLVVIVGLALFSSIYTP